MWYLSILEGNLHENLRGDFTAFTPNRSKVNTVDTSKLFILSIVTATRTYRGHNLKLFKLQVQFDSICQLELSVIHWRKLL